MKALFFWPMLLFVVACGNREQHSHGQSAKTNHLTVIIEDQLWNGEVGDSIRKKFAAPIVGLQQEEPLFNITQYPLRLMEGYSSNDRNILVIKREEANKFKVEKDKNAKPQNVFYLSGQSVPKILQLLEANAASVIATIRETELGVTQKQIDSSLLEIKALKDSFHIGLRIPSAYKMAMSDHRFLWLKKDMVSGNMNVLVYDVPLHCLQKGVLVENITRMRDSVGALYIHGTIADSKMITERAFAPYLSHTKMQDRKTYETRGTWELSNDYMSGPFVNLAIVDKTRKRILVLEGFCYAPSKEKRELLHELEAIIRSVTFNP